MGTCQQFYGPFGCVVDWSPTAKPCLQMNWKKWHLQPWSEHDWARSMGDLQDPKMEVR